MRESRYAEAEKHARLALEIDKCDPIALDILGDILRDEGYLKDAEGMYLKAFWSRPSSIGPLRRSEIHNDLGWVYSQLKYYDKAKEEFKLARDLDPNNVKAIRSLRALSKVKSASEMSDPEKWLAGGLLGYLAISVYFFYR